MAREAKDIPVVELDDMERLIGKSLINNGDLYVAPLLTNLTIGMQQKEAAFAALGASPQIDVLKQDFKFNIWNRADINRDEAEERSPSVPAPMMGQRLTKGNGHCKVYHLCSGITEEDMANEDPQVPLEETLTKILVNKLMIKREREWAAVVHVINAWKGSTGTGGGDITGVAAAPTADQVIFFDDFFASDPVVFLKKQIRSVCKNAGVMRQDITLTTSPLVLDILEEHPKFKENFEHTPETGIVDVSKITKVLRIKQVRTSEASYTTSLPAADAVDGSTTTSFVLGKDILLSYAPEAASLFEPCGSAVFNWTNLIGAAPNGIRISKWFERSRSFTGWIIMAEMAFVPVVTMPSAGAFITGAVSPSA